jgi:hypothetical protein
VRGEQESRQLARVLATGGVAKAGEQAELRALGGEAENNSQNAAAGKQDHDRIEASQGGL